MTNEEAIEIIKIARAEVEWEYPMDYAAAFDKAIEALEQEPKWIPVSERLPEESGRYLAYIVNEYDDKLQYIMTCEYSSEGYWNWFPDDECASDNVIAWMPLPEPMKAESEETETWNGIHAQITAPKGTFERIFNDADDDNDI